MKRLLGIICVNAALLVLIVGISSSSARAQGNCLPFSGTIYGYTSDALPGWAMLGDFTIGQKVYHAVMSSQTTSVGEHSIPFAMDVWRGTELWTWNFNNGDKIQTTGEFVTEHANFATNTSGIFHMAEVCTFANGTGMFKNAYGSILVQGPFGPNVVAAMDKIQPPAGSTGVWYFIAPAQGTVCGMNNRWR